MPSKATTYYSTDLSYSVYSSFIDGHFYDPNNLYLYVRFFNNKTDKKVTYQYFGVPKGVYAAFKRSPSQGVFLHENIRQSFQYRNIGDKELSQLTIVDNPLYDVFPDLKKLDILDNKELSLTKSFDQGNVDPEQYYVAMAALESQREKLVIKLEKQGYKFDDEPEQLDKTYPVAIDGLKEGFSVLCESVGSIIEIVKFVLVGVLQIVGMFSGLMAVMMKVGR